jgi:hypothetical protein
VKRARPAPDSRPADPMAMTPHEAEACAFELSDLSKFTNDPYWNPNQIALSDKDLAELRARLEPLKRNYDEAAADQMRHVKSVAEALAKSGELDKRVAKPAGQGAFRHTVSTFAGKSYDVAICTAQLPELSDTTIAVNAIATSIHDEIISFFDAKGAGK